VGSEEFDFTVASAASVVEFLPYGMVQGTINNFMGLRLAIDAGGTPLYAIISVVTNSAYGSVNGAIPISGLSAGAHTVKFQCNPQATAHIYRRSASFPLGEVTGLRIVEHHNGS
jgi:hypothetical protein